MDNTSTGPLTFISTLQELLDRQISFQKVLGNDVPDKKVLFEDVQKSLEHNTYQNIEFQEFMEANNYDKKEELIDYLLFMLNKYIFLGVNIVTNTNLYSALWGDENCCSSAACSCYASIEQYEYIKLLREHCTFKPWKVRQGEDCVEYVYVYKTFDQALGHFRKLARVTFDNAYDLESCLYKKLMINIERQNNGY